MNHKEKNVWTTEVAASMGKKTAERVMDIGKALQMCDGLDSSLITKLEGVVAQLKVINQKHNELANQE